jgi:hypothetical protein
MKKLALLLVAFLFLLSRASLAQSPNLAVTAYNLPGTIGPTLLVQITNATVLWGSGVVTVPTQTLTMTASATNYIYFSGTSTLSVSTTGFPSASSYYPVAVVLTNQNNIFQISDQRPNTITNVNGNSAAQYSGPVINVTGSPYNASNTLADNNSAFTAAATAANAVSLTAGNPAIEQAVAGVSCSTACSGITTSVPILNGDTVLVLIVGFNASHTFTVTAGTNTFFQINPAVSNTSIIIPFATAPSQATAASSVTVTDSGTDPLGVIIVTAKNVGSYNIGGTATGGGTALAAGATVTYQANDIMLTGMAWYVAGNTSATANVGTIQVQVPGTASIDGEAVVTSNPASAYTSIANSVTLSGSANWSNFNIDLRSRTDVKPTVYIPAAATPYFYSGGLSFSQPMTLKCEPGAVLWYIGSAHAVDFGPTTATAATITYPYILDGCTFMGGVNQTQGVFFNEGVIVGGVRNSTFRNFGNINGWMIAGAGNNWDLEIGPQNRFHVTDNVSRNGVAMNLSHVSTLSYLRFHDNEMYCINPEQITSLGCGTSATGIGILMDGEFSRVYHNNLAFFNPIIESICSAGSGCFGNQIDQNQIEQNTSGTGVPILYDTQGGMLITQNSITLHGSSVSPIGPFSGTSALSGARINFNTIGNIGLANPVVVQNNVGSQAGNQSYGNNCSTTLAGYLPCALIHTSGASIAQWDADQWVTLTFSAATTASYTWLQTYSTAPKCGQPTAVSPGTTTFTITTLNTTTLTVTASASFTGTVIVTCSMGMGQ